MTAENARCATKPIEDLSLKELDMIYSLMRVGEWPDSEIARRYRISESNVHKVFDNYPQLREEVLRNPLRDVLPKASELTTEKSRKRRSDAIYATGKERQAAYRARLRESRRATIEEPSPAAVTDVELPLNKEPSVTVGRDSATEISYENAYPQPENRRQRVA